MQDPLPISPRSVDGAGASGEDARIEQLLVAGLDQYFAGDFETAINLWTRVLFLDRHHDRARAYIERARSTLAERQRESEALVHQGLAAFDRGDVEQARTLLSHALDEGASHDLALGVLGRIERLDVGSSQTIDVHRQRTREGRAAAPPETLATPPRFWAVLFTVLLTIAAASWWVWTTNTWQALWPAQAAAARMASIPEVNTPLPVPTVSEAYFRRGQDLFEGGRLRDALVEFDRVPAGDLLRPAADEMRAHIQRELLALALQDTTPAAAPPPSPSQPPE